MTTKSHKKTEKKHADADDYKDTEIKRLQWMQPWGCVSFSLGVLGWGGAFTCLCPGALLLHHPSMTVECFAFAFSDAALYVTIHT